MPETLRIKWYKMDCFKKQSTGKSEVYHQILLFLFLLFLFLLLLLLLLFYSFRVCVVFLSLKPGLRGSMAHHIAQLLMACDATAGREGAGHCASWDFQGCPMATLGFLRDRLWFLLDIIVRYTSILLKLIIWYWILATPLMLQPRLILISSFTP